jgi:hypothetical protein
MIFVWVGEIGDVRYDAMETRWVDGWRVRGTCSKRYLMPSLESAAVLANLALTFANVPLPKKSAHSFFEPLTHHSS